MPSEATFSLSLPRARGGDSEKTEREKLFPACAGVILLVGMIS